MLAGPEIHGCHMAIPAWPLPSCHADLTGTSILCRLSRRREDVPGGCEQDADKWGKGGDWDLDMNFMNPGVAACTWQFE